MLKETYRLGFSQSQVLRSAMELGLPPWSNIRDFFEQSRESKSLSHKRGEPGKACFKGLHLGAQRYGNFEKNHLESIRRIRTVPVERGSASREHNKASS